MLGKLFKYELRSGALPVPFMLLALGIVYLLGLLADALKISQMKTTMAVALVLIGVAALVLGMIYVVSRCAKGLYGAEGYLMQTLPVSRGKMITVKVICGYLVLLMSGVVFVAALAGFFFLNDLQDMLQQFADAWKDMLIPMLLYMLGSVGTQLLAMLGALYLSVALANTRVMQRNNVLMAIVFYFVCSTVISLVELAAVLLLPFGVIFSGEGVSVTLTPMVVSLFESGLPGQVESINEIYGMPIGLGNLLADVLMGVGMLIGARWVMEHKASVK
ncbi:MAG: hypothetical protein KHX46_08550 [Clostridiales bacterium]|nr:hypothetical protein [Clostridiales bacterium]